MSAKERFPRRFLAFLGVALIGVAAGVILNNLYVSGRARTQAEETYERVLAQTGDDSNVGGSYSRQDSTVAVDGRTYIGTVEIESIDLQYPVSNEWRDEDGWSRLGACRYSGSVRDNDLVIAVYDATITGGLTSAADGDKVVFTDVNGQEHEYQIATVETVAAEDIDAVGESSDSWELTLLGPTFSDQDRIVLRCVSA